MKKIKYILLVVVMIGFIACDEDWMTTHIEGDTMTVDDKAEAMSKNDAATAADVLAMYTQMVQWHQVFSSDHNDWGIPTVCGVLEATGQDWVAIDHGYNWFRGFVKYPTCRLATADATILCWRTMYNIIRTTNLVIEAIDPENHTDTQEEALCQAKTVRAYCYSILAQLYQFNYVGHENKLCVPIVKENMNPDQLNNNPRKTVQEVFQFIMDDLNYACNSTIFKTFKRSNNGTANQAVAYGLRARVNLLMDKKQEAANDAQKCLQLSGATPLSIAECGEPGFCDESKHNVIWAAVESNNMDWNKNPIQNWVSHFCTWYLNGYAGVGGWRCIYTGLYDQIPATDVRKQWWVDDDGNSALLSCQTYGTNSAIEDLKAYIADPEGSLMSAHVNLKFGTKSGAMNEVSACASDWMLMRAEEMHLIIAEATGDESYLTTFVQQFRNPNYTPTGNIINDVWLQRRIELWGEGFAFLDLLRYGKELNRIMGGAKDSEDNKRNNWDPTYQQTIPANDPQLLLLIPQSEVNANNGIPNTDN